MKRASPRTGGFALFAAAILVTGLFSALVDNTLGWEHLAQALLLQLPQ